MRCLNPALDTKIATLAERRTSYHTYADTLYIRGGKNSIIYRKATSLFHFHTLILSILSFTKNLHITGFLEEVS